LMSRVVSNKPLKPSLKWQNEQRWSVIYNEHSTCNCTVDSCKYFIIETVYTVHTVHRHVSAKSSEILNPCLSFRRSRIIVSYSNTSSFPVSHLRSPPDSNKPLLYIPIYTDTSSH
jgi:hypothetical protein